MKEIEGLENLHQEIRELKSRNEELDKTNTDLLIRIESAQHLIKVLEKTNLNLSGELVVLYARLRHRSKKLIKTYDELIGLYWYIKYIHGGYE